MKTIKIDGVEMRVVRVCEGLAWVEDGVVFVNGVLYQYPWVLERVLEHESRHLECRGWWFDLWVDVKSLFDFGLQYDLLRLRFLHPCLNQSVANQDEDGVWHVDWSGMIFLFVGMCVLAGFCVLLTLLLFGGGL